MSRQALVSVNVLATATQPVGQHVGDVYWNTADRRLYVFDGTSWIQFIPDATADIIEGGNEAAGSDTYTGTAEGGNEAGGTDTYTSSYNGGGVVQ